MLNALQRSLTAFPGKEFIIVLEDFLTVTPDFLHYFSQTLHLLEEDDTLMTVSAWNPNGRFKGHKPKVIGYQCVFEDCLKPQITP